MVNLNANIDPMESLLTPYRYQISDREFLLSKDIIDYRPGNIGTVHALIDAALLYYFNDNIMNITLPKIREVSGFSQNVIYKYYKTTTDIVTAALNRELLALEMAVSVAVTVDYQATLIDQFKKNYNHLIWMVESGQNDANILMLKSDILR